MAERKSTGRSGSSRSEAAKGSDAPPLLDQLHELGRKLPPSAVPSPSDLPLVVAALVHQAETGSLEYEDPAEDSDE